MQKRDNQDKTYNDERKKQKTKKANSVLDVQNTIYKIKY